MEESDHVDETNDDSGNLTTNSRVRKKRKRDETDEDTGSDIILPENCLEIERSLQASAIKNNLSEKHVKHIIKKVVTNDHVLALVQLQEEEELSATEQEAKRPKLTRAKVKELMKCSPQNATAPWNLELSPINQIPVKTRPEVTALIAHDLPDESDEEYQPTHDEASDDDQDSQPRTPATPSSATQSPQVVTDGPFKVPQEINTPVRRKLDLEEPTIALRTRSKLSLSETPIEHIESSFVPPDELPHADVDDLWNQFLSECLDPAPSSRNEDDDEADPEYNADNDPDAHEREDEEALESSLVKISKKELSDLVTELFHILPEGSIEELAQKDINNSTDEQNLFGKGQGEQIVNEKEKNSDHIITGKWEGKREIVEYEPVITENVRKVSIGKSEIDSESECEIITTKTSAGKKKSKCNLKIIEGSKRRRNLKSRLETEDNIRSSKVPASLKRMLEKSYQEELQSGIVKLDLPADENVILPEQVQILEQQLRQHIQLCTSNFLQLYIHPIHWQYAPKYKEYLESFYNTAKENPKSVVKVCNLEPAVQLVHSWEATVSEDTPANKAIVEHIEKQSEKFRRRMNSGYTVCSFHPTMMDVVASSTVFLYPHLLPAMPYRPDPVRRYEYFHSEDAYLALGIKQFSEYITDNPDLYPRLHAKWQMTQPLTLVKAYMLPWQSWRALNTHVFNVRKARQADNPLYKFLVTQEISPMKHKLLPFNPNMTLYQQPEYEMPLIWLRYVGKTNGRFKQLTKSRRLGGIQPQGVPVTYQAPVENLTKDPLPFDYLGRSKDHKLTEKTTAPPTIIQTINTDNDTGQSTHNITITNPISEPNNIQVVNTDNCIYRLVATPAGAVLMPVTETSVATETEKRKTNEIDKKLIDKKLNEPKKQILSKSKKSINHVGEELLGDHCTCCKLIRDIYKERQTSIKYYFSSNKGNSRTCPCKKKSYPNISNKLKILVENFQPKTESVWRMLHRNIIDLEKKDKNKKFKYIENKNSTGNEEIDTDGPDYVSDLAIVLRFQLKFWMKVNMIKNQAIKRKLYSMFNEFVVGCDCPLYLARQVEKACREDLLDIYREFLTFYTESQAETLNKYTEYFISVHLEGLMKKIKEEIPDVERRLEILNRISQVVSDKPISGCYLCSKILPHLSDFPQLAQYFFSLFPHRHKDWKCPIGNIDITLSPDNRNQLDDDEIIESQTIDTPEGIEINVTKGGAALIEDAKSLPNIYIEDHSVNTQPTTSLPYLETENVQIQNTIPTHIQNNDMLVNIQNHVNTAYIQNIGLVNIQNNMGLAFIQNTNEVGHVQIQNEIGPVQIQHEIGPVQIENDIQNEESCPAEMEVEEEIEMNSLQPLETNMITNSSIILKVENLEPDQPISDEDAPLFISKKKSTKKKIKKEPVKQKNVNLKILKRSPSEENVPTITEMKSDITTHTDIEIKCEIEDDVTQWSRDEDKELLELLKTSLALAKKTNNSIEDILSIKSYKILKDKIPNKSLSCIKTRINYLTQLLMN